MDRELHDFWMEDVEVLNDILHDYELHYRQKEALMDVILLVTMTFGNDEEKNDDANAMLH